MDEALGRSALKVRACGADPSGVNPISASNPALQTFAAHATNGVGVAVLDKAMESTKGTASKLLDQLPQVKSLDPKVGNNLDLRV
jgi:hypothetical protein